MKIAFFGDSLTEGNVGVSFFEILQRDLPHCSLFKFGQGGDTVISMFHRLPSQHEEGPFDLVMLWIGVNDVFSRMTCVYRIINRIRKKRFSRTVSEFKHYYQAALERLLKQSKRVIAVEPLLIGEDPTNPWNIRLGQLSQAIQELSIALERVEFLDLRTCFFEQLKQRTVSRYLPTSVLQFIWDKRMLSTTVQVDRRSYERGLHFTLDGVHLNSAGAKMISEVMKKKIELLE